MKKVCAIIGGSTVTGSYLTNIRKIKDAECRYIFTNNKKRFNCPNLDSTRVVSDINQILSDKSVNKVFIVNEPSKHLYYATKFIKKGISTLIEKPIDINSSYKDRENFKNLTKKLNKNVSVVSQLRFDPTIIEMKNRLSNSRPLFANIVLSFPRSKNYYEHGSGWRARYGSVFMNQAIHWLDILSWFFGKTIKVTGFSKMNKKYLNCADTSLANLEYKNKLYVNLAATTSCPKNNVNFEVFTEKGIISYSEIYKTQLINKTFNRLIYPGSSRWNFHFQQIKTFILSDSKINKNLLDVISAFELVELANEISKIKS